MSGHSELPWSVNFAAPDVWIETPEQFASVPMYVADIHMREDSLEAFEQRKSDAAFIVRCVNSHDELLALVRDLLHEARQHGQDYHHVTSDDLLMRASDALAKAEHP